MKKSKNNNIILVCGFLNLVSVDAKERPFFNAYRLFAFYDKNFASKKSIDPLQVKSSNEKNFRIFD